MYGLALHENVDTQIRESCVVPKPGVRNAQFFSDSQFMHVFRHTHRFKERDHMMVSVLAYKALDKNPLVRIQGKPRGPLPHREHVVPLCGSWTWFQGF